MSKFKVGDRVKVAKGKSSDSKKLDGQIGTVIYNFWTEKKDCNHCKLDIEGDGAFGIWDEELTLVKEGVVKTLSAHDLAEYIKEHGITKCRTTETMENIPAGTVLFFGLDSGGISTYNYYVKNKNDIFRYNFGVQWCDSWYESKSAMFEVLGTTEKLINDKMELDEIKKMNKAVLAEANKEVLEEIADEQKVVAKAKLRELYDKKAAAEKKASEASDSLKDITKDLGALTVKGK